jgi:bifunctional non-homologous end joining protein LigD
MPKDPEQEVLVVGEREVAISNPRKVLFPEPGYTKLDLAQYYLAVSTGALRAAGARPNVLVRYPNGVGGEFFYQKRAPESRPAWIDVVTLSFPSGRTAEEVVPRDAAALAWMANLACLELHPHPVRADDLDHPDELRVDLDPVPGVAWEQVRAVAQVVHAALDDFGLAGWPKTSGSRGIHVYVRIERKWMFDQVRRAALALAREVEQRAPAIATSKWWKEERHGVFLDYNQNAKDRTMAAAYSVRPVADARVSAPLSWDEIDACDPRDFTLATMPKRFAATGDCHADMEAHACSIEALLELSARHAREGLGDAPWPPHYRKQAGEPARVQPSRRRAPLGTAERPPKPKTARRGPAGASPTSRSSARPGRTRGRSGHETKTSGESPGGRNRASGNRPARSTRSRAHDGEDPGTTATPLAKASIRAAGRRTSKHPLIEIGRALRKEDALAGLDRWRARHANVAGYLEPADVLVDAMRGRSSTWTRIRVNLQHVPEQLRPPQEPLDPDEDPWRR